MEFEDYEAEQYYLEPKEIYCKIVNCSQCGETETMEEESEHELTCSSCGSEEIEIEYDWIQE